MTIKPRTSVAINVELADKLRTLANDEGRTVQKQLEYIVRLFFKDFDKHGNTMEKELLK